MEREGGDQPQGQGLGNEMSWPPPAPRTPLTRRRQRLSLYLLSHGMAQRWARVAERVAAAARTGPDPISDPTLPSTITGRSTLDGLPGAGLTGTGVDWQGDAGGEALQRQLVTTQANDRDLGLTCVSAIVRYYRSPYQQARQDFIACTTVTYNNLQLTDRCMCTRSDQQVLRQAIEVTLITRVNSACAC